MILWEVEVSLCGIPIEDPGYFPSKGEAIDRFNDAKIEVWDGLLNATVRLYKVRVTSNFSREAAISLITGDDFYESRCVKMEWKRSDGCPAIDWGKMLDRHIAGESLDRLAEELPVSRSTVGYHLQLEREERRRSWNPTR